MTNSLLQSLQHGLIVSCQAYPPNPFAGPHFMAAFAQAATMAGAVGLRVNGADDVAAVHAVSPLPIIGIVKEQTDGFPVYITPSLAAARVVVDAGAQIVAIDATHRPRASGATPEALIRAIRQELGVLVMADVDTLEEGRLAAAAGADIVASTLAGYTPARAASAGPDFALLAELVAALDTPVICEGRIHTPADVRAALDIGAHAVVVGTAITNPLVIAQGFVEATRA